MVLGVIVVLTSSQSRRKERAMQKGISKETLVDTGLYAFVRHPLFLGHILIVFSLILIGQHVANLVIGGILILPPYFDMVEEEKQKI